MTSGYLTKTLTRRTALGAVMSGLGVVASPTQVGAGDNGTRVGAGDSVGEG